MEANLEKCPLCGTELSRVKLREIESKLREEEQRKANDLTAARLSTRQELEEQFRLDLEKQKKLLEKKSRDEAERQLRKIAEERDLAARKLKEAEAREVEIKRQAQLEVAKEKAAWQNKLKEAEKQATIIRAQAEEEVRKQKIAAEKQAKEEVEGQIKKLGLERDQATKKLKEAEARDAAVRKEIAEEAEKQRNKELAEQRHALEKDKNFALLKQQSAFNRERESLQKKLQRKTANELGDAGEIDVFDSLSEFFRGDRIERIKKGQPGADILHEVHYKGEPCGRIIIDSKNRQSWQNNFVTKLRQDQVEADAEHAILATGAFPAGKSGICNESGVIVVSPAHVVHLVEILRRAMIAMHIKGLSIRERTTKMSRLYDLITSEMYSGKLTEANRLTQDILDLEVQEQTTHSNVWKKRGSLLKRIHHVLRGAETEIAAIIEGNDPEAAPPSFGVKGVSSTAAGAANQGRV